MRLVTVNSIKLKDEYIEPGSIIEVTEKDVLKHLLESGAATSLDEAPKSKGKKLKGPKKSKKDIIKELKQIEVVNDKIASDLMIAGFDDINKVSEASVEDLTKVKGISKELAEEIYRCFA